MTTFDLNERTVSCMNGGKELEEIPMKLHLQGNNLITYTEVPHGSSTIAGDCLKVKTVGDKTYWLMLSDGGEYLIIYDVQKNIEISSDVNRTMEDEETIKAEEDNLMQVWNFLA